MIMIQKGEVKAMFHTALAGAAFTVHNRYQYVYDLFSRGYITDTPGTDIFVSDEEIAFENKGGIWPDGYLESLAVYRKICESLLECDTVLFHSSALAIGGKAYLFTGPSGTGKSTHARLWRERFQDKVVTINDDKPLLKIGDEQITVYGTPYGGKDMLQTNTCAPVGGIVILHQASDNSIRRISSEEAFPYLLNQTYRKDGAKAAIKTLDLVACLSKLPVYSLGCTISQEAVELAYKALTGSEQQKSERNIDI